MASWWCGGCHRPRHEFGEEEDHRGGQQWGEGSGPPGWPPDSPSYIWQFRKCDHFLPQNSGFDIKLGAWSSEGLTLGIILETSGFQKLYGILHYKIVKSLREKVFKHKKKIPADNLNLQKNRK